MLETKNTGNSKALITKREFLKRSFFGVGGIAANMYCLPLIAIDANNTNMEIRDDILDLLKHSREAAHYTSLEDNYIKCNLCPNGCTLAENGRSICRNKFNVKGKLYTIAYGNPCIVNTDPIEKKPLFHYLPNIDIYSLATAGCNLRCLNCQNWTISQVGTEKTENYDIKPEQVVKKCSDSGIKAIAYTYSEPIAYFEYMLETAKLAKAKGIKNVMVTNGYINEKPLKELCKYIDAASVNLKSFKDSIYQELNKGSLQPVLNTLKTIKENDVWLEIINLVVPTWTDNMDMIKEMCLWLVKNGFSETPLHFSRFTPMYKLTNLPYTPVSTLDKAIETAKKAGIKYIYMGNVPGHVAESTYCPECSKKIINRKGFTVIENCIINNKCKFCNTAIAGVWE